MKKYFLRFLSLLLITSLTIGLYGCGQEGSNKDGGSDGYEYVASFKNITENVNFKNEYVMTRSIYNGKIYAIVEMVDEYYQTCGMKLIVTDMSTGEALEKPFDSTEIGDAYLSFMKVLDDNTAVGTMSDYSDPSGNGKYYVIKFSLDGKILSSVDVTTFPGVDEYDAYINRLETDKDGNIVFGCCQKVFLIDKDFNFLASFDNMGWIQSMCTMEDGNIYLLYYDDAEDEIIKAVDVKNKTLTSTKIKIENGNSIFPAKDGKIFVSTDSSLKKYDIATGTEEKLFSWLDVDIAASDFYFINEGDNKEISLLSSSWSSSLDGMGQETLELANLKYEKITDANRKQIITLGTIYINDVIKNQVLRFNKSSENYRVKVLDYGDLYGENYMDEFEKAIISGNTFDVIDFSSFESAKYTAKGLLEDLYTFMDKDESFNKDDYFENVFKAFEEDGKLYLFNPTVMISALGVTEDVLEGKESLSFEDFVALKEKYKDTAFLGNGDKENVLRYFVTFSPADYINPKKGECYFDSEEFKALLQFANTFPEKIDYDTYDPYLNFRDGKEKVTNLTLSDVTDYQMWNSLCGNKLKLVGYPSKTGSGFSFATRTSFGISSKSKVKEGAWELIKSFLSKEYQTADFYGFPIVKEYFDEMMEKSMQKDTYVDENGQVVEMPKFTIGTDNLSIEIYASAKEDTDAIREAMEKVDSSMSLDYQVHEIILEEAEAYFKGAKSLDETASVIQNRVKLYLQESR